MIQYVFLTNIYVFQVLIAFLHPKLLFILLGFCENPLLVRVGFKSYEEFEDHRLAIWATRRTLYGLGCVMSNPLIMAQPRNKWHNN
jgi:hypothetical protein